MNARRDFLAAAVAGTAALTNKLATAKPTDGTPVFWAVVELMGHTRFAGRVSEQQMFGKAMMRVDIPTADGTSIVQFFDPGSGCIYRLSPTTETEARKIGLGNVTPISAYDGGQTRLGFTNYDDGYGDEDDSDWHN